MGSAHAGGTGTAPVPAVAEERGTPTPSRERSVLAAFTELHSRDPHRELFVLVDERGHDTERLTVDALAGRAEQVRALLAAAGTRAGDRVLLLHLPSLDFVVAFLGALAAGAVPVPVAPPAPSGPAAGVRAVAAIAAACDARAVLTHAPYAALWDGADPGAWPDLPWLRQDGPAAPVAPQPQPLRWHTPDDLDEPAFLQFTSGSTGSPKGVVVSHRNIHHELDALAADLGLGDDTVAVSWVPHFHDLGLVSFLLNTLVGNAGRTYVISPLSFLARPAVWFDVLSRVRGTHTSAPNFAYDLMVRRTTEEQRAAWDLSAVRVLGSSGEMVQAGTVERFFTAFAGTGVAPEAFRPGYGLAEHTLSVSMGTGGPIALDRDQLERHRVEPAADGAARPPAVFYGSGWVTKPGAVVRIVDPATRVPCAADGIGEIWVDSATKARGYWGLDEQSAATFGAVTADGDPRPYLRTGDLGFLHDGELFVTGRLKDLVIVRGHNYSPQDIEDSVRGAHPRIRGGGVAAFSVPPTGDAASGERLILLVETTGPEPDEATVAEIRHAARRRVRDDHGIACHDVLVGTGLVLKTTSGKVRRSACRAAFLAGEIGSRAGAAG
ncbi:AMP-binding protein [Pseudonocardia sp. ICBG1293]|uniref:AMP-binding protein n=1 Tax=Pseudonocardia sp. ICBG1293 TaxID=2844382 RepID=UPI001CCC95C9|nr:AMP-binding protein [Pseudonocardia sp. ICBG1293]